MLIVQLNQVTGGDIVDSGWKGLKVGSTGNQYAAATNRCAEIHIHGSREPSLRKSTWH